MPITLTTYPDEDLAIFRCAGVFQYDEWMAVGEDYLDSQAAFQINDIRDIDFTRVTADLLRTVVLTTKQHMDLDMPARGKTAFIIKEDFQEYDLFNTFMLWVHTLGLHRDFALFFSIENALEWFGLDPALAPDNLQEQPGVRRSSVDSQ